jgi:hypothetical protein
LKTCCCKLKRYFVRLRSWTLYDMNPASNSFNHHFVLIKQVTHSFTLYDILYVIFSMIYLVYFPYSPFQCIFSATYWLQVTSNVFTHSFYTSIPNQYTLTKKNFSPLRSKKSPKSKGIFLPSSLITYFLFIHSLFFLFRYVWFKCCFFWAF